MWKVQQWVTREVSCLFHAKTCCRRGLEPWAGLHGGLTQDCTEGHGVRQKCPYFLLGFVGIEGRRLLIAHSWCWNGAVVTISIIGFIS